MPHEFKPRDVKRHRTVTGDEKWIHYDNPQRRKSCDKPNHASTSTEKPNIHDSKLLLCIIAFCSQTSNLKSASHEIWGTLLYNGVIEQMQCKCKAGSSKKCKHGVDFRFLHVYV